MSTEPSPSSGKLEIKAFTAYQQAAFRRHDAEQWIAHQIATDHITGKLMKLSACAVKLTIAGQYSHGGTNYWDAPTAMAEAVAKVIRRNWQTIEADALAILKEEERLALVAAEAEIAAASDAIAKAKAFTAARQAYADATSLSTTQDALGVLKVGA